MTLTHVSIVVCQPAVHDYMMASNELDDPDTEFATAYNNPKEATQFVSEVNKLMDKFMTDIRGYDRYKQEEAYEEFTRKYTKLLKELDDYFEGANLKLAN